MFASFIAFLKLIWPFFKESMLEDGTLRDWVKRHWTTIVWILFQIVMLLVCFYLADIIRVLRHTNIEKNEMIKRRDEKIVSLDNIVTGAQDELQKERESNQRMRKFLLTQCQSNVSVCHFLIDETIVRPNEPTDRLRSQRVNQEWCLLVRDGDLEDQTIRQRFLRECGGVKVSDVARP